VRFGRKTFPRESIHTEISPLRFASVEMTKGRAVLPERVVAEPRAVFSSPWVGGPKAHDSSGRDDEEKVVAYRGSCDWDVWISGGE
jgi:hypothetical protein